MLTIIFRSIKRNPSSIINKFWKKKKGRKYWKKNIYVNKRQTLLTINNHRRRDKRRRSNFQRAREKVENSLSLTAMDTNFWAPPTIDKRRWARISKRRIEEGKEGEKGRDVRVSSGCAEIETLKAVLRVKKAYVTVHWWCAQVRRHKCTLWRKKTRHPWYIKHVASCLSLVPFSRCDTTLEAVDAHPW